MIQWGILGIGNIAKRFIKSLEKSTNGQLYAAASYTESKCEEFLKEHPDVKVYHDYEDLLNDENVDAVYLAMRHIDHYRWAKELYNIIKLFFVKNQQHFINGKWKI